jgi:hypothetical protein
LLGFFTCSTFRLVLFRDRIDESLYSSTESSYENLITSDLWLEALTLLLLLWMSELPSSASSTIDFSFFLVVSDS